MDGDEAPERKRTRTQVGPQKHLVVSGASPTELGEANETIMPPAIRTHRGNQRDTVVAGEMNSRQRHRNIYHYMDRELSKDMPEYQSFLTLARTCLPRGRLASNKDNVVDILDAMESENWIAHGNYESVITILNDANLHSIKAWIRLEETTIQGVMAIEGNAVRKVKDISESQRLHCKLYEHVNRSLTESMYTSFLTMAGSYIPSGKLAENKGNIVDVLWVLETEGHLDVGHYRVLIKILKYASLPQLEREVQERANEIQQSVEMKSQDTSKERWNSGQLHRQMYEYINRQLTMGMSEYRSFLTTTKAYLPPGTLASKKENVVDILDTLESDNWIGTGSYSILIQIVNAAHLFKLEKEIEEKEAKILEVMKKEGKAVSTVKDSPMKKRDSRLLHRQLYECINRQLTRGMTEFGSFLTIARIYLPPGKLATNNENVVDILDVLESENLIGIGNYNVIVKILHDATLHQLERDIKEKGTTIQQVMKKEGSVASAQLGASEQQTSSTQLHRQLYDYINRQLTKQMPEYRSFLTIAGAYLPTGKLARNQENVVNMLDALESENRIAIGNYKTLLGILKDANFHKLGEEIKDKATKIHEVMENEGKTVPSVQAEKRSDQLHRHLFENMNRELTKEMPEYQSFLTITRSCLPRGRLLAANKETVVDILDALESENWIAMGNYRTLVTIAKDAKLHKLEGDIQQREKEIQEVMRNEGKAISSIQDIPQNLRLHCQLYEHVNRNLTKAISGYGSFLNMAESYIPTGRLAANIESSADVLWVLETEGHIGVGDYKVLFDILHAAHLRHLENELKERATKIQQRNSEGTSESKPVLERTSYQLHRQLYEDIRRELAKPMPEYRSLLTLAKTCLPPGKLALNQGDVVDILLALESENWIAIGNYENLIKIFQDAALNRLKEDVKRKETEIRQLMQKEGKSVPNVQDLSDDHTDVIRKHNQLYEHVNRNLTNGMSDYNSFLTMTRAYIPSGRLAAKKGNIADVLCVLETEGHIGVGNYQVLLNILHAAKLILLENQVQGKAVGIQQKLNDMKISTTACCG